MCKKCLCLMFCLAFCSAGLWAQSGVVQQGAKRLSAKAARQAAALPKKVGKAALSNKANRNLLRREERLNQILDKKIKGARIKTNGHLAGKLYPNTVQDWSKLATDIPGFVKSWPQALDAYEKAHNGANFFEDIQAQIKALYPQGRFAAAFVASFDEVLLLKRAVRVQSTSNLAQAIEAGLDDLAYLHMPGYAAVMVDYGGKTLRDVLILDIQKERVISLNQSQGQALARLAFERRQAWRKAHPRLAARLDKQGFVLDEKHWLITKDGITWAEVPHGEIRRNLDYAWKQGWYAQFKHGSWEVEGFSEVKGGPLQQKVPYWLPLL